MKKKVFVLTNWLIAKKKSLFLKNQLVSEKNRSFGQKKDLCSLKINCFLKKTNKKVLFPKYNRLVSMKKQIFVPTESTLFPKQEFIRQYLDLFPLKISQGMGKNNFTRVNCL